MIEKKKKTYKKRVHIMYEEIKTWKPTVCGVCGCHDPAEIIPGDTDYLCSYHRKELGNVKNFFGVSRGNAASENG